MPTYIYETVCDDPAKARRFEVDQRMSEKPLTKHPETGEPVRRVITGGLGFTGVECRAGTGQAPQGGCNAPGCGHAHH
jgi:predicted nucleic acid-binding Zn ribbon protein